MHLIRRVLERKVYSNQFGTLFDDEVAWSTGRRGRHLRLRMGDGPGVVVIPRSNELLGLVKTYRYAIDSEQWAFPRGFAQHADPLATARAELEEEMGVAGNLALIGSFTPDSGVQETRVAVVLAEVSNTAGRIRDIEEVAEVQWVNPAALLSRLGSPGWEDGMTMAALTLLWALEGRPE